MRRTQNINLLLIFLICTVSYMDRGTLAVANPLIRQDLGLSVAEMGVLLSAFLWPYAFSLLLAGPIVDHVKPRRVLVAALIVWSIAQGAAGFVGSYLQFILTRAFLGVGEAPVFPTASRVTKDWYHETDQALRVGIWNGASSFGTAIAPALLTPVMLIYGWRWMFMLMAVIGFIFAGVWYGVYRDLDADALAPNDHHYLYGEGGAPETQSLHAAGWSRLFGFRATWGLILGFFGNVYVGWMFTAWLPGYLEIQRHMSIPKTGLVASVPFLFGLLGSMSGGWLADRLAKRGMTTIGSRKLLTVIGMVVMSAGTIVAAETPSNLLAVVSISVTMFFSLSSSGTSWALSSACAPPVYAASMGAIMDFGGFIGGALAPTITGFIVQATGSFTPALLVAGAIGLVSSAMYVVGIPAEPIRSEAVTPLPSQA
ncbi:MAG TPA: MFS transporter [Rhodopila sp.]|uniref:MFS transporter n=1 Tax=Rhodopila sp. TaxID=2480087 RepID=UPI002BF3F6A1|nr:MFS transporter [Rhodopila sp.]HVY16671.1 MFS transporter [Rhodopila sp.]